MNSISIIEKYKLVYRVNGEWHTKPLTPEVMNKLSNDLTEANFVFDIDDKPPEYFYDDNKGSANELPSWSLFSAIRFEPNPKVDSNRSAPGSVEPRRANRDNGGSFFKYLLNTSVNEELTKYLVRLQLFDSLMNNNKPREEWNDCCFVYALSQTGCYDEETLNTIRLRIQNRYLSN